jgi:hypothetical protein
VARAESEWFDVSRRVRTSQPVKLQALTLQGRPEDAQMYIASRPASAREALSALPIERHGDYALIDFGSGKGRVLFLAAEYPFRRIQGIEFALELHRAAEQNIRTYRHRSRQCASLESLHLNAQQFEFPDEPQVLFFFNPFLPAVMSRVLDNLSASLARHPRPVWLVLLFPELAAVCDAHPCLHLYKQTRRYHLYSAMPR